MSARRPNIVVHVERLVLDGIELGPGGADRVRVGLEAALADGLARGLTPDLAIGGARAELPAVEISLPRRGATAPGKATDLGRSVGSGLSARLGSPGGRR